jgi:hypothetical protein
MSTRFYVEVDWDKDDAFTDEGDNTRSFNIRRGRRETVSSDRYAITRAGEATVTVKNNGGRFNFFNASSPIYAYLLPNRPMRFRHDDGTTVRTIFTGTLTDIRPQSDQRIARLEGKDGLFYLGERKGDSVDLHTTCTATHAIQDLLTASEWIDPQSYALLINNGDDMPYWWGKSEETTLDQINTIAQAFAGDFYVAKDGSAGYRARAYSGTSILTLTDADVMRDSDIQQPWDEIRNEARITAKARSDSGAQEIWRLYDTTYLDPSESKTIWAQYQYNGEYAPMKSVTDPVVTTDYTAGTTETGTGEQDHIAIVITKYATEAKLVITNNSTVGLYMSMLKLRGNLYIAPQTTVMTASDSTSQTAYNKRALVISDNDWLQEQSVAQDHADFVKSMFANPRKIVWVKIKNRPSIQFACDLYDQVTLNLTTLTATGDYWITYIEHDCNLKECVTTWRLEPTPDTIGDYWVFTTILGVSSRLGW